jgi:hypothetical protein
MGFPPAREVISGGAGNDGFNANESLKLAALGAAPGFFWGSDLNISV